MKLLIIDDDKLIRLTIKSALLKAGYEVIKAENGSKGLALFAEHNPSVVITDMLMPDKRGTEIIAELKAKQGNVGIIAISGGGSHNDMSFLEQAKEIGAHVTLKKPFRPAELIEAVEHVLQQVAEKPVQE